MPGRSKGARLWLRRERRGDAGTRSARWFIRDGSHIESTGCVAHDLAGAERALSRYVATKHARASAGNRNRHPSIIPIADILMIYLQAKAVAHARPEETKQRIRALAGFFGDKMLSYVNGNTCRAYAETRPAVGGRRELEDFRAAINHHRREGLCSEVVEVVLPPPPASRDRWLTRQEAARAIRAAWRYREVQNFKGTDRRTRQHIARFILVGIYTGTRASAICGAALQPTPGRGWIDLDRGVFYRRPAGKRETKKRQPPVPLPTPLLAHMRRWARNGQRFVVEWNGEPVARVSRAFASVIKDAKLEDVTPHVLRHTSATWLMQAGTDPWQAAGYLGMTLEMLMNRYGHHHPEYLARAKSAFERMKRA